MAAVYARGIETSRRARAGDDRRSVESAAGPVPTPKLGGAHRDRLLRRASRSAQSGTRPIGLAGVIEVGLIASLLQMWAQSAATGTLHLETDECDGEIELEGGEIVSARLGNYLGRAACFRALSLEAGQFRYHRGDSDAAPTSDQRAAARTNLHCLLLSWISLSDAGELEGGESGAAELEDILR